MTKCLMDESKWDTTASQLHNINLYNSDKVHTVERNVFSAGTRGMHTGKFVKIRTYASE